MVIAYTITIKFTKSSKTNISFSPFLFFLPFLSRSSSHVLLSYPWSSSRPLTPPAITQHHKFPSAPSSLRPLPLPSHVVLLPVTLRVKPQNSLEPFFFFYLTYSFIYLYNFINHFIFILFYPKSAPLALTTCITFHSPFLIFKMYGGATLPRLPYVYTPSKSSPLPLASIACREEPLPYSYHEAFLHSNSCHEAFLHSSNSCHEAPNLPRLFSECSHLRHRTQPA